MVLPDRGGDRLIDVEADGIADLLKRDGELVFDGFDGDIQDLGDLAVFETVFFHQLEDDLALGGKLFDRTFDEREHVGGDQQLFGIEIDAGEFRLEFFYRVGDIAFVLAEIVERGVPGRHIKINPEVFDLFQLAPPLPYANKDVRNDLFGRLPGFDEGFGK